ncbi:tail fiber domain-containing protein [Limosilactobacillus fermentum]|uniref:tail fiber domain-containing protein n=1 Tax=Limosilactobacillus fermentum TaxID=1613 RepID=UPI0020B30D95|nr:hypothetical protein [Limosilactobacillus fermentum]UTF48264.1 hypothetical protein NHN16_03870 [Limosilactobacillus fermentum]
MPMDNVTLENTQQSISSRDAKSVASVMVNGKWVNLSDTLEQANVKSYVGTVAKQVAAQQEVVSNAASTADSAVAYANDAIEKSKVNSQAIDDINSAVSDAVSDAAVARSDGLRAWNAAQSNVNLIDLNYASASAAISSARTEAIAAADEAKSSASAAQADIVVVKSDVAAVQADVTATRSDVAVAKSDIADTKTTLAQTTSDLNSKITGVETSLADTANALSDAKTAFNSDVAAAKQLANMAQTTADSAVKSASSVASDLTAVASQAKANADGITKVTSDVGTLQTTVADNSGNISTIQETAKQIQQAVSDNAGNITVAKQTADSAVAVASDARSNATVAIQTASQASITANNASGQAASAVLTANGALTTASNAKSDATVAVQTASGASLTAINANSDATVAKQTASEAKVQASNAESDFAQLSIRAGKIEASVANNSGAIASVQQTANGLTTTVGEVNDRINKIIDNTNWTTKTGVLDMNTLTTTQNIYYRDTNLKNADGEAGWAYIQVVSTGERVTQTVWHDRSSIQHTRTGAIDGSTYDWDAWNQSATNSQVAEVKQTVDGITTTVSNIQGDVSQLKVSASSASVALSDAAGNISSLQATATSYSAALSDTNSNVASVTATASELETKYADAAGDISQIKTDAKGMTQTISDAQGDIAKLKTRADGFDAEFTTANGNISKLQTDATGTTQTLANTKSDVAVLQSRADGLDAKYADAAGDINTLKANASGVSQTLTNAQGDISTLKSTVSGVQTTLTDAQGNISTLQSDVSGLKKTTSDNAGNIATLQASAQTLTSQMSSAQGDISTLKQTASDFSSKVSGMETSLSDANSKINSVTSNGGGRNLLQGTGTASGDVAENGGVFVKGAFNGYDVVKTNNAWGGRHIDLQSALGRTNAKAGDWYTISIYVKADKQINDGHLNVYGAIGNAITDEGALNGLWMTSKPITTQWQQYAWSFQISDISLQRQTTTVAYNQDTGDNWIYWAGWMLEKGIVAHDWSPAPEDTDAKITANTTATEQNKEAIALKADQTTVDNLSGEVSQNTAQLKVQADQINAKVSSSDLDAKGYATQTYTQTQIKQTSDTWNVNLTKLKNDTQASVTSLSTTVDGLTTTVGNVDNRVKKIEDNTNWTTKTGVLDMNTLTTTQNIYYRDTNLTNADGEAGWAYIQVVSVGERVTQTVWHDHSSIQHTRTGAIDGSTYDWDAWNEVATNAQVTAIKQTVDGIQTQVYNSDGSSRITQLSNIVQSKVSQGDYNSQITQLNNAINQRVQVGNVISQINQEAGGNTLIQVSNGKGSLILNADNTIMTGKAWIPAAAIANLTADQVQAGTLSGSTIHLDDNNGNTIDLGGLATNYVGFHSKATNGDQTYIDSNGIHNYGATYDTRISQGMITTNLLSVNGGGLIDFRDSNGTGMVANGSTLTFDVNNTPAGYLSYNGMPVAELPDGSGGNELQIRYGLSTAIIPSDNSGAQATFSKAAQKIAYMTGTSQGKQILSGLEVHSNNHHWLCAVNSDATCNRFEVDDRDGLNIAWHDQTHLWLSDGNAKLYKDNNDSQTATKLEVHGWAWVNGWVEAAGHSQHSALSTKTDLQTIDDDEMLEMVNNTDLASFLFKTDVASGETHRHIGLIIDDVHDVAQYQTPQEFIAPNGASRDDDNMIGALFGAVKALTKRIKTLESKVG